ncbi:ATP-binding protein [Desulfovibrio inopinatus]|uniref:ATP-binding protein n=1 Tax=Desulfovibrio inopinatus TaxID=102109 RepID=UPI000685A646|nr:ATP-binding protein [Desulfovibrio inopinatus]
MTIQQSRFFEEEARQRGLAIAKSLEAACLEDLLTYNHTALEQKANQAAADDGLAYIIIHNKEGVIAGYSNRPDLSHKTLSDAISQRALTSAVPLFQQTETRNQPVLDVSEPVRLPDSPERWGTIRVGVSLSAMHAQIFNTRMTIAGLGFAALGLGALASIILARRVTRPLSSLVEATANAAKGKLDTNRIVASHDEIGQLASRFLATVNEIVAKKEALAESLEEIKTLERYRENLLRVMSEGLVSVSTTGEIVHLNPAAQDLFSKSGHPLEPGMKIGRPTSSNALIAHIAGLIAGKNVVGPREVIMTHATGDMHILVSYAVLLDEAFALPREFIVSLSDITALRRLEADIRQAKRLSELGTIAASIVHEIRNPLTVIDSFVQLLPNKIDKPKFREKLFTILPQHIKRIVGLMEDLLQLSRPVVLTPSPIAPGKFVTAQLNEIQPYFEKHHITQQLSTDSIDELPEVFIDSDHLSRALVNIFKNAAEAMPTGGHLDIVVQNRPEDQNVRIVIRDNGPGIPENILPEIFTPFKTGKATGTGLGLALTHKIITEHRGTIKAENIPNHGAQFTISLPVVVG